MATRNRRRRRRRSAIRRRWKTFVVALGFCALAVAVAVGFGAAWAVRVYNSAPPLSSLKPVQKGRSSAIYARDGTLIGFIRSSQIRQPVPAGRSPRASRTPRSRSRTATSTTTEAWTTRRSSAPPGRTRSPAASRCRAPRRSPSSSSATSTSAPAGDDQAQADRGAPRERHGGRALEALDPRPVPEHIALRHGRRGDGSRRRGGGRDLLRQARPDLTCPRRR
jgi:hypothetical protein